MGAPLQGSDSSRSRIEVLKAFPLFAELGQAELELIAARMEPQTLAAHSTLLTQNENASAVYFLIRGAVQIVINGEMVAQVETVQCFGEMSCLIPETPASATVQTAEESDVLKIARADFLAVVNQIPLLWKTLFLQMNGRAKAVNMRLSEVLVHTPQGLVKVDRKGIISNEYSMKCTEYFGKKNLSGIRFSELTRPGDADAQALWAETYPMLFDEGGMLSFSDVAELLDREITYTREDGSQRVFVLTYYPCRTLAGAIDSIDVGIEDVTEARELERKNAQMLAEQNATAKIYDNPESFLNLQKFIVQTLRDALQYLKKVQAGQMEWDSAETKDFMRKLHSLKGYSSVFALKPVQQATHHMEDLIQKSGQGAAVSPEILRSFAASLGQLKESYRYTESIFARIGEGLRKRLLGVALSQSEFGSLKRFAQAGDVPAIRKLTEAVEKIDSLKLVSNWSDEAAKIAAILGKEVQLTIEGDGGAIPKRVFESLDTVLIHLLRNSVDHGLESPEQRAESGKPAVGAIQVRMEADEKRLHFEISDDGRGIDFADIAEQAKCNEQIDPATVDRFVTSGEPWRILFLSGFSTSETVTEISGRGVGLAAVKSLVDSCKGQVGVEAKFGSGAVFKVDIPLTEAA